MSVVDSLKNKVQELTKNNDPAHDFTHIMRVYANAKKICRQEKVDEKLVLSAVLLHDMVVYPKSHKLSKMSSMKSAEKSKLILKEYDYSKEEITIISDAIRDHSFSQNKLPDTLEGKILQDADRLDALGAIGIARVFSTGGSLQRPFYHTDDPFCNQRIPNDTVWTLDHFYQKLFKLESLMNTKSGRTEARIRTMILTEFLNQLKRELYP